MFIVYRTKIRRSRMGQVVEFCPLCRELGVCTVRKLRKVSHIYYIPLGWGKVVGHEVACDTCR